MAYYISGLQVANGPAMTKLQSKTKANVQETAIYGSDTVEVDIVSLNGRELAIELYLANDESGVSEDTEVLIENMEGLMERLSPLHIRSDEVPIYGTNKDVFVVIKEMDTDWETGTRGDRLIAKAKLNCIIVGTPKSMVAKYGIRSQTRNGDYNGLIEGRSVVGLPYASPGFPSNVNFPALEQRNETYVYGLASQPNGFANDTLSSPALEVKSGDIRFKLDVDGLNFLENAVKVFDEGYSPRRQIFSRHHNFQGDLTIEHDLYKIRVDPLAAKFFMYEATGLGTYEGSPFVGISPATFTTMSLTINREEMVRVKTSAGDYIEVERGKDPVIQLSNTTLGMVHDGPTPVNGATDESQGTPRNYIEVDTGIFVASNYGFTCTDSGIIKHKSVELLEDAVYMVSTDSNFVSSGRYKEILKEIS